VNVKEATFGTPSPGSLLDTETVADPYGLASKTTENLPVPPASVVVRPLVGLTVTVAFNTQQKL
jgi:hypothetical protein